MRALIRYLLILTFALSLILAAIIGLTYRDSNRFAYLFTRPDGSKCTKPCLFGVDPSSMTYSDALKTLQNHPSLSIDPDTTKSAKTGAVFFRSGGTSPRFTLEIHPEAGDGEIEAIRLTFADDAPSLGNLMFFLGKARAVGVDKSFDGTFVQARLGFLTNKTTYYGLPFVPASSGVTFEMDQPISDVVVVRDEPIGLVTWAGFALYEHYQNEYQKYLENLKLITSRR